MRPVTSCSSGETTAGCRSRLLGVIIDQRLAPRSHHLPPQAVKVLRRRGGIDDLDVVLGRQGQESLQPGARMLGPHSFEAVRQQQHHAAEPAPLVFGAGDELIDDHLGRIDEVAELGLPHDQAVGAIQAIAILEAQHARLGQRAVDRFPPALGGRPDFPAACRSRRSPRRATRRAVG